METQSLSNYKLKRACEGHEPSIRFVISYLNPMVDAAVASIGTTGAAVDKDDLRQEAALAILHALDKFDTETYGPGHFVQWIKPQIRFALMEYSSSVGHSGPSIGTKMARTVIAKLSRDEELEEGAEQAAAAALGLTADAYELDEVRSGDFATSVTENLALQEALETLTSRERLVVECIFGLHGGEPMTDAEVAPYLNIDRSNVSRTKTKALAKLEEALS